MYAALLKLKSIKMDNEQHAEKGKVKEEPFGEMEYSEVRDGADLKGKKSTESENEVMLNADSILNVKLEKSEKEDDLIKEPLEKDKNVKVKKEPMSVVVEADKSDEQSIEPTKVAAQAEDCPKDLNENSKASKDESVKEQKDAAVDKTSAKYISNESFKRNMHHMFPTVHEDIIKTFRREFCGLCGAHFDAEKRAWTHYFSPEHNHALTKKKKFSYPPFWKMIKLALAEVKPAGASKKNIYEFIVKTYPGVKTLKESEIYDQLGKNLVDMVTHFQNVQIGDDGDYKLKNKSNRSKKGNKNERNATLVKYFKSDKRWYIPESGSVSGHHDHAPQLEYEHRRYQDGRVKDEHHSGYRNYIAKTRGGYEDERVRGYGQRRDGGERERRNIRSKNMNRSRSRSRSNSRRERPRHGDKPRHGERSNYEESKNHRESRRRSNSRQRNDSRSSRRNSRRSSGSSQKVKAESNRSPPKQSPPPSIYQPQPMQMPMLQMPGSMEGAPSQPIIIIPSNMASGGFPHELLGGSLGMSGMQLISGNNFPSQFSNSFQLNTPPGFSFPHPSQMFRMPSQGSGIPSPPLSASPPLQSRAQQ